MIITISLLILLVLCLLSAKKNNTNIEHLSLGQLIEWSSRIFNSTFKLVGKIQTLYNEPVVQQYFIKKRIPEVVELIKKKKFRRKR